MDNKKDMVKFLDVFEKHLVKSVLSVRAVDLRSSNARVV
jgi:hypothetical protein